MEGGRRRRWQHPATEALLHNAQAAPWVYIKSKRLKQTDSAKIPHRKKALTITAFAIFICMVPTVSLQVQRGEKKKQKKKTELRCCSQARPGWQCGSYVSRETGKETATTLLLLYRSASWQLQNKRQTKAVLSFHVTVCQSRWRKWQTADLNSTFFLWIGETLIQPSKSRTVFLGGGGGGRDSPVGLYFILLILSYWSSQQQVPTLGFIEGNLKFGSFKVPFSHFFIWEWKNSVKM